MSKIKHLGKFTDEGDYIELPFVFDEGKYRVEIKPSGETKRDKTIYVDESGVMKLPNYNGRKAFAPGSNIFLIYRIVNSQRERIWKDGYSRFSLFLKTTTLTVQLQKLKEIEFTHLDELILPNDFNSFYRAYRNGGIWREIETQGNQILLDWSLQEGETLTIDYY